MREADEAVLVMIPGPPCAQGRGRAVRVGAGIRVFDPARSRSWKGAAQVHMKLACPKPMVGPLSVSVLAVFPCPKGDHRRVPVGRRWHAKAGGDLDNVAKAILDAGNGVLWMDDREVSVLRVAKIIGAQGEGPQVLVRVERLALEYALADPLGSWYW